MHTLLSILQAFRRLSKYGISPLLARAYHMEIALIDGPRVVDARLSMPCESTVFESCDSIGKPFLELGGAFPDRKESESSRVAPIFMALTCAEAATQMVAFSCPTLLSRPTLPRLLVPGSRQHTVARRPRWTCKRDGSLPGVSLIIALPWRPARDPSLIWQCCCAAL